MDIYVDTETGTWGEAVDLRLVPTNKLESVIEFMEGSSYEQIIEHAKQHGRQIDTYVSNPNTANAELMFLVCKNCGEAFDTLQTAHEHGTFISGPDPSWCGEDGFDLLPESEAM